MASDHPAVAICGPATWNDLILLDELPQPVPHMQFAKARWSTIGGTSAGKSLHLAGLRVATRLHAFLGTDDDGMRIGDLLSVAGVDVAPRWSGQTEKHVNLMTSDGARVSLYTAVPSRPTIKDLAEIRDDLLRAEHAVVDLSEAGAAMIDDLGRRGDRPTLWVDLHDYNGRSEFHEPFVRNADVVFMNADAVDDPWALVRSCVERGPRVAVCTLGAEGAIAVDATGTTSQVPADDVPEVVDTNGAGDAFMAGFIAAHLGNSQMQSSLQAGATQAAVALGTRHLHPVLDRLIA